MARIAFVTGNPSKAAELRALLHPVQVVQERRGYPEIQADTLEEVAEAGARHLLGAGLEPPFVLEDAGLFVAALNGFPGVYSRHALDTIGNEGLLRLMEGVTDRAAAFRAALCYVGADREVRHFLGVCEGRIATRAAGSGGFGFDPVFVPAGAARTFAQMTAAKKGAVSHRGRAAAALRAHLGKAANR